MLHPLWRLLLRICALPASDRALMVFPVIRQVHYLDNYFNESPLDGRIFMKIQLNMPPKVSHCGMLRLKDSTGFMSSYFAAIEGNHLNLWDDMRAAEEEQVGEPLIRTLSRESV